MDKSSPDNTVQNETNNHTARAGAIRRGALFHGQKAGENLDEERKPDAVMIRRVKGTTFVVNFSLNQDSKENAADKMARLIEREADEEMTFIKLIL